MRVLRPQLWRLLVVMLLISVSCSQLPDIFPVMREGGGSATGTDSLTPEVQLDAITLPPTVVEFMPRSGQVLVAEDAVISVLFDQPMDRDSVEEALHVTPEVEGEFSWKNDRELYFKPKVLAAAKEYQVSLGTGASSQTGSKLGRALTFAFSQVEATPPPKEERPSFPLSTSIAVSNTQVRSL